MRASGLVACALALVGWGSSATAAPKWTSVPPALLSETQGLVDPEADVEAISWTVEHEGSQVATTLRLKIYTQRGVDDYSRIELSESPVKDAPMVWARTTRPDGSSVDLDPDDVFLDTLVRVDRDSVSRRAFSPPGLEPGCVLDYRWMSDRSRFWYFPLQFDLPIRTLTYRFHGAKGGRAFLARPKFERMTGERGIVVTHENVPALRDEVHDPPLNMHRPWVLLSGSATELPVFVRDLSVVLDEVTRSGTKAGPRVKEAAAALEGEDAFEIAESACRWLRERFPVEDRKARLRLLGSRRSRGGLVDGSLALVKAEKILKGGEAETRDLTVMQAALVKARGYDMRIARVENRALARFSPSHPLGFLLPDLLTSLPDGEGWRFYDPGHRDLPCNMIDWRNESAVAVVSGPSQSQGIIATTPVQPASKSARLLSADVSLSPEGDLAGTGTLTYTGHQAGVVRRWARRAHARAVEDKEEDEDAPLAESAAVAEYFQEVIEGRLGARSATALALEGLGPGETKVRVRFDVEVPGFARRTGKRLFFRPSLSTREAAPRFTESKRHNAVFFRAPWTEVDSIRMALPEGYELRDPTSPAALDAGAGASFSTRLWLAKNDRELQVRREFSFGATQELLFPASSYSTIKGLFDAVDEADEHTLALQRIPAPETEQ